jgi:hypothetical protein
MRTLTVLTLIGMLLSPVSAGASGVGKSLARSAGRRVLGRSSSSIRLRDARNHALAKAKPLSSPRSVNRFTGRAQAQRELRTGIAPNRHMTATAPAGRPLSQPNAQRRFGLPRQPQVRETIRLPKGFPVRHNHAVSAGRGVAELTSPKRVPPTAIRKVRPLTH